MASLENAISFEIPCSTYTVNLKALENLYRILCDVMGVKDRSGNFDFCYTVQHMMQGEQQGFWIDDKLVRIIAEENTIDVRVIDADGYAGELKKRMAEYVRGFPDKYQIMPNPR